jgi:predicted extracellular nuclease
LVSVLYSRSIAVLAAAACLAFFAAAPSRAASPDVVISQIYGGGGNSGATLTNDFIELFNRGAAPVSVAGWSVQYASAAGTSWQVTALPSITLAPGEYLLVQESQGTGGTTPLPAPDASGTIAMSATAGKVALVTNTTALTPCSTAADCLANPAVRDLVGYGTGASAFEGSGPTSPSLTNTTAALRANGGCTDTDNNAADFARDVPGPRNSASPFNVCGAPVNQPVVAVCPTTLPALLGAPAFATLSASDADGTVNSVSILSAPVPGISIAAFTPAPGVGGSASLSLGVANGVPVGTYSIQIQFANNDATPQTASCSVLVTVVNPVPSARIHDIQGAAHISPLNGTAVSFVPGIVTVLRANGFNMQDPVPDSDPATSEGIFVFTNSAPTVQVGDSVAVSGKVAEFRPGGSSGATNLTQTEIDNPQIVVFSSGNPLPAPVLVGAGGRVPPTELINSGNCGDVELSTCSFDPANDGIDFWESLEGMRVQLNNAIAVGPTNSFGETMVVADMGAGAELRSGHGGVLLTPTTSNPQRVVIDDTLTPLPAVNVGDWYAQVVGVMDYAFGNFHIHVTEPASPVSGSLLPETTSPQAANQLAIASFNVENLSPSDPPAKYAGLANEIVRNLQSPDIVAVMEIQDNSGASNDGTVDATTTFNTLIAAIQAAGGPAYQFRSISPQDGQDGGQPGGNIRQGFLFNPARVSFIDRPGGDSTTAVTAVSGSGGPQLSFSPGRIDPTNPAFTDSRKPLAGEFMFNMNHLFLIANHLNSKGGDQPLFGHFQPPALVTEAQRVQQAQVVAGFVQSLFALDSNAKVVVLGDMNDFEFSPPLAVLKGAGLNDLAETLAPEQRYTYVFEGNSQVLDHILASNALMTAIEYDIVHVNSEFAVQASDHEPEVARLYLPKPVVDVTRQVRTKSSRLKRDKATRLFDGTITVTNAGIGTIAGPLQIELDALSTGVLLVNASGTHDGAPILTSLSSLAPGASVTFAVQFAVPSEGKHDRDLSHDKNRDKKKCRDDRHDRDLSRDRKHDKERDRRCEHDGHGEPDADDIGYTLKVFSGTF